VLVRNDAALADVAARHGYRTLPAGVRRRESMMAAVGVDTALRALAVDELRRMARSSTQNSSALHPLAMLLMMDGAWDEAAQQLHEAMAVDPRRGRVREQLGVIALAQGRPTEALVWFERERALGLKLVGVETRIGQTHEALGDPKAARRAYTRELERHPEFAPARAALQRLGNP
jgi:Tfp pilus assembly protein PilF